MASFDRPDTLAFPEPEDAQPEVSGTRLERQSLRRAGRRSWFTRSFVVIAAVTALGGALRFYHLSSPHGYVFDEVYYAKDACFDAGFPYRQCQLDNPVEQTATVHPPLGRWIMAAAVRLTSKPGELHCAFNEDQPAVCNPFGFRVASATFGTISILLVSILALRLFGSVLWAGVAGLLLATENLNFVQSRVGMLDIFVTTFVLAGFLFLVLDRQWIGGRTVQPAIRTVDVEADLLHLPPDRPPSPAFRPWRLAAGLAFGAAVATKWSGAPALAGAILLTLAWERTRRREIGQPHPIQDALRDESFGIVVFLVLVPLAVYVASFARFWADNGLALGGWWHLQQSMASYSIHLRAPHPYASKAWSWLLLKRPVDYYYQGTGGRSAEILALGNPLIFWGTVLVVPYLVIEWIRKRDWRAGFLFVAFIVQYVPWLFAARTLFLFYMAPMTPFMVLGAVYAMRKLSEVEVGLTRTRGFAPIAAALVVIAVGMFVFFLPVLTGRTISHAAWMLRMWYRSCVPHASWCWI